MIVHFHQKYMNTLFLNIKDFKLLELKYTLHKDAFNEINVLIEKCLLVQDIV